MRTRPVLALLGLLVTIGVMVPAAWAAPPAPVPATPYPGGTWSPPAPTYGTVVERDHEIPMSDGVVLVGDITYPTDPVTGLKATGRFPVLLTQNPYRGLGVGLTDLEAMQHGMSLGAPPGEYFVQRGYIFVTVDVRGTSRSGGTADAFGPRPSQDGVELVRWASTMPGSNGKVGLKAVRTLG
jgi:predicted acyl esterase